MIADGLGMMEWKNEKIIENKIVWKFLSYVNVSLGVW